MKNVTEFPNTQKPYEQASEWLFRLEDKELDDALRQEFNAWLSASPKNKQAFKETVMTWGQMSVMEQLSEIFPLDSFGQPSESRSYSALAASIAAVFVFGAAGLFGFQFLSGQQSPETLVVQTSVGGNEHVELIEGSEVTLNTNSKIEAKVNDDRRQIDLLQGEAFFEVEHNENTPFVVVVDDLEVEAVGTAFSILRAPEGTRVIVTEGKVKVTRHQAGLNSEQQQTKQVKFLEQGTKMFVGDDQLGDVELAKPEEINKVLLWQKEMLLFSGDPLIDVIKEFSRYTNVNVTILDEQTEQVKVGGYFRSDDIDGLIYSLENNFNIKVIRINDSEIMLGSAPPIFGQG